jgi:thioredoxin-dependent peroxiredoxin
VKLSVGDVAPDFLVKDHLGRDATVRQFRGRKVLLWFYPKADTPGCSVEGRGFRDVYEEFQKRGIEVLGCSFDTVEENAAFAKKFDFPFLLLCDVDREIGLAYGACDEPNAGYADRISYLIDEDGFIAQVYDHVEARNHPARVLENLKD